MSHHRWLTCIAAFLAFAAAFALYRECDWRLCGLLAVLGLMAGWVGLVGAYAAHHHRQISEGFREALRTAPADGPKYSAHADDEEP